MELGHHQAARAAKWTYFYLYVMLDVFSRYVVGWMVADRESATQAEQFIHATCARQGIAASSSPSTPTAFKLLEAAQGDWRRLDAADLIPLVRAGVRFVDGVRVERQEERKKGAA